MGEQEQGGVGLRGDMPFSMTPESLAFLEIFAKCLVFMDVLL